MKSRMCLLGVLAALLWAAPARADNRFIVRSTLGLPALQAVCSLPAICTVVGELDGTLGQLFLITTPLDLGGLLTLPLGIVDAEVDQLLSLVDVSNLVPNPLPAGLLSDRTLVSYCGGTVWNAYATQPAADVVHVAQAQNNCTIIGAGIVADIDTGVDPNHPALKSVLVPGNGYDFTRNQAGGSEMNDLSTSDFPGGVLPSCPSNCTSAFTVNQS